MFAAFVNTIFGKKTIEEDNQQYVIMTYRNKIIKKLPTTYYQSDSGWGCMLRVGQMAIANLLFKKQMVNISSISTLFWDNSQMPFSIQNLTAISSKLYPNKKQFQWYTPCQTGFILKNAMEHFDETYSISICNDNSIFFEEIQKDRQNVIIMIMSRLGLDKPEPQYLETLIQIMKMTHFFSILGGTPKLAHLFMKYHDGYFGFLDPHQTNKAAETQDQVNLTANKNLRKLQWIKKQKISSSLCIMFVCNKSELQLFWLQLKQIKKKQVESFFIYMQEKRPEVNPDDIFQIIDIIQQNP